MAEKNEPNEQAKEQYEDKAGDILRKERVTRRITVETIAKDLKLNVSYIKALEANQYDALPADPYVRVYLRSIANYLMLNPDEILKRFYRDRGITPEESRSEREEKISVSLNSPESGGGGRWVLILILVLILAALGLYAYRSGWIVPEGFESPETELIQEDELFPESQPNPEEMLPDTGTLTDTLMEADTADTLIDTVSQAASEDDLLVSRADSLELAVSAIRDSVWIRVFYDGRSWRNFIYANETRVFNAVDSFNLRVGNNNHLRYSLNGESIKVPGSGVTAFKVDHEGVEKWTLTKWNRVFQGR